MHETTGDVKDAVVENNDMKATTDIETIVIDESQTAELKEDINSEK